MPSITYYVALPFVRTEEGDLVPGEAKDFRDSVAAKRAAQAMAAKHPGAVAFSRSGDPATGDFAPAVIIATFGKIGEVD